VHGIWRIAPVASARMAPAWADQCWAIAVLGVAAVLLNWVTTGDHLLRTIGNGYWPVAGVDLAILVSSAIAVVAARKLKRRAQAPLSAPGVDSNNAPQGDGADASLETARA